MLIHSVSWFTKEVESKTVNIKCKTLGHKDARYAGMIEVKSMNKWGFKSSNSDTCKRPLSDDLRGRDSMVIFDVSLDTELIDMYSGDSLEMTDRFVMPQGKTLCRVIVEMVLKCEVAHWWCWTDFWGLVEL